jgi:hypothetical protein
MQLRILLLILVLPAAAPAATAQEFNRVEETASNSTSYYYYVQPGSATIETYVMGTVRSPGLYVVEEGTDLGQLLALSGGPVLDVLDQTRRRKVTIRLFRPLSYSDHPIFELELDRAIVQREPYPTLRSGDVLTVEIIEERRFDWRDLLTVVGGLSALAIAIERGVAISK